MQSSLSLLFVAAALVAGLVFPPLSSYTEVYVVMGAMLLGGILFRSELGAVLRHPAYIAVLVAFSLFAITLPFVWHGPDDLLIIVALLPVPLGIGLVLLLGVERRFASPVVIAGLSLAGAFAAVIAGLNDVYVLGLARAGSGNNPIHYADLAMVLGFFSLIGLFGTQSRWRLLFLLGPFFGLEAIFLSQTRGALLAYFAVAVPLVILMLIWLRHNRLIQFAVLGSVAAAVLAVGVLLSFGVSHRILSVFPDTRAAISILTSPETYQSAPGANGAAIETNGTTLNREGSTFLRLVLIRGSIEVFVRHPLFGVGTGQIISAARVYFPENLKTLGNHLHTDPGDFAAAAGIFGLAGYLVLLLAPFLRPAGNYGAERRRAMVFGAAVLSLSYLMLGLTNAVFGVLPQTVLFGTLLAALVAMGRNAE